MRPLSVAIYHATLPPSEGRKGGVEAAVHRLANSLARRDGIDVWVYSSGLPPRDALYQHRRVLDRCNRHQLSRIFWSPWMMNGGMFGRPDVIHLHGDDWFFLRRRSATVRTLHGSALREAQFARRWPRRFLMAACYLLEMLSARLATVTVSISRDTADLYPSDLIVGNSVDRHLFHPRPKAANPTVLFVGGWGERKRGAFMFDQFVTRVLPRVPDARLLMVSDHCPEHPSVVHGRGLSDAALAERMAEAWVFGYPSTYEGFGIAYVEALASGTAIVTSPNPGSREVLEDGRYGLIVGDDVFGDTVADLLLDGPRREALERAGAERAAAFDEARIVEQVEQAYHLAIDRFSGGRRTHGASA